MYAAIRIALVWILNEKAVRRIVMTIASLRGSNIYGECGEAASGCGSLLVVRESARMIGRDQNARTENRTREIAWCGSRGFNEPENS